MKDRISVLLLTVHDFLKMLGFCRDDMGLKLSSIHPEVGYQPLVDWARFEFGEGTALELFAESRPGSRKGYALPKGKCRDHRLSS